MNHFRITCWVGVAILCGGLPAAAQLEIGMTLSPTRAILQESIIAQLRIRNTTSEPITLGGQSGAPFWLDVERGPGRSQRQLKADVLGGPLTIPPRETVTHRLNVTTSYDLRSTGSYTVRARTQWRGRPIASSPVFFDVVPGMEYTRTEGVLPDGEGIRTFRLMSINRDRGEDLLLRIDDDRAGICFAVLRLGRLLRTHPPQMRVDESANITVLHQAGPGRYLYHVFTPDGENLVRRIYTGEGPGVELVSSDHGRYIVSGATSSLSD